MQNYYKVSDIAKAVNKSKTAIKSKLNTLGIEPSHIENQTHYYSREQVEKIVAEYNKVDSIKNIDTEKEHLKARIEQLEKDKEYLQAQNVMLLKNQNDTVLKLENKIDEFTKLQNENNLLKSEQKFLKTLNIFQLRKYLKNH